MKSFSFKTYLTYLTLIAWVFLALTAVVIFSSRGRVDQPRLGAQFKAHNISEPAWFEPPVLDYVRGPNSVKACDFYSSDTLRIAPTSDLGQYWQKFDGEYWIRIERIRVDDVGMPCSGWVLYKNLEVEN